MKEREAVIISSISNNEIKDNSNWNSIGSVSDLVFLLSYTEVENYFHTDESRVAKPTQYTQAKWQYTEYETCMWWLRNTGIGVYASTAGNVDRDGRAFSHGGSVEYYWGVRPAIWIDLTSDCF